MRIQNRGVASSEWSVLRGYHEDNWGDPVSEQEFRTEGCEESAARQQL
jgi:hypothetical protein